jgi:steroid 5-alpha reductase family enzyme
MSERWTWVIRYAVVIAAALILGAAFGEMALFKTTKFGRTGPSAAQLVQFLGYGGALFVLWLTARRAATLLPGEDPRWNVLKSTLLPLTTLIVVSAGQAVLLLLLAPLMNKAWHQVYNWVSVTAIILSAAWLLAAVLTGSSSLAPLFGGRIARRNPRVGHQV